MKKNNVDIPLPFGDGQLKPVKHRKPHKRVTKNPDVAPGVLPPRPLCPDDGDPRFMIGYGHKLWHDLLVKCVTDNGTSWTAFQATVNGGYLRERQTRAWIKCRQSNTDACVEQLILEFAGRRGSKTYGKNQRLESLLGMMRAPRRKELQTVYQQLFFEKNSGLPLFSLKYLLKCAR